MNRALNAWIGRLVAAIEKLTEVKPAIHWIDPGNPAEIAALSWWELAAGNSGTKVYVGVTEASWRSLDAKVSGAKVLEQSSERAVPLTERRPPCDHFQAIELDFSDQQPVRLVLGIDEDSETASMLGVLSSVEVPITVRFGSTRILLQDLVALEAGSAMEFDRRVDEHVDILVHGRLVARGEAVVVRGNYGIRITEVTSRQNRLNTTGGVQIK